MMPLAAITDEFSPDLERALGAMAAVGMTGAELRVIGGKNTIDLSDAEIDDVRRAVESRGIQILSIASPLLKCVLPDAPPIDPRFQQDIFGSSYTFEDQARLTTRAFEIARRTGAGIIRVFSYWRTVDPSQCFDRVVAALADLAEQAAARDVIIGLENEPACNIATAAETAAVLAAIPHPNLQMIWDPANALVAGESPFPGGYALIPPERLIHVHAKDCTVRDHTPAWCAVGDGAVDWRGQIDALERDGYRGWLSLETHWKGPNGDKMEASTICARNLRALAQ
jgi:L-ribulose-5-phosphate 3-epimerase